MILPAIAKLPKPFGDICAAALSFFMQRKADCGEILHLLQNPAVVPESFSPAHNVGPLLIWEWRRRCTPSLHSNLLRRDHLSTKRRGELTTSSWLFGFSRLSHNIFSVPLVYEKRFWVVSWETVSLQPEDLCSVSCVISWTEKSWCFLVIWSMLMIFLRCKKGLLRIANWEMSVWRQ